MRSHFIVHYFSVGVLLCLFASTAVPAGESKSGPGSFQAVVRARFKNWDLNQDGRLSPQEVGEVLGRLTVTGKAAAALAAIHVYQRHPKHVDVPVTLERFTRARPRHKSERRDEKRDLPNFEEDYQEFLDHLDKVPRKLFIGKAPSLVTFRQGNLGDCYFLAAIGAAVHRNPDSVRKLFQPQVDGACQLTFPNGKKTTVYKLTDGDIMLGSSAGKQGLWLNTLEKGFGKIKSQNPVSMIRKEKGINTTPIDAIAHGGNPVHTIALLTGHKGEYLAIWTSMGKKSKPPDEKDIPELVRKVRAALIRTQHEKRLICCGTEDEAKLPPGILENHAYAVLDFNPGTGLVHIWNPWGSDHVPKGKPGRINGYLVKDGHFEVPIRQFVQVFEGLYYETEGK